MLVLRKAPNFVAPAVVNGKDSVKDFYSLLIQKIFRVFALPNFGHSKKN